MKYLPIYSPAYISLLQAWLGVACRDPLTDPLGRQVDLHLLVFLSSPGDRAGFFILLIFIYFSLLSPAGTWRIAKVPSDDLFAKFGVAFLYFDFRLGEVDLACNDWFKRLYICNLMKKKTKLQWPNAGLVHLGGVEDHQGLHQQLIVRVQYGLLVFLLFRLGKMIYDIISAVIYL